MRVVLFAVLFAIASTPAVAADKPESKYKGKPLAYWVERLQNEPLDANQQLAALAIVSFKNDAAPAVPQLLALLEDYSPEYRDLISEILCNLGPAAKDAVPVLAKRLKEKKTRDPKQVLRILGAIGPDAKEAVPAVAAMLDDPECRSVAVTALCGIGPAAKDALPGIRKVALEIVAAAESTHDIQDLFQFKEPGSGPDCLKELHLLGADVVPILLDMIEAPGNCGKHFALRELGGLGPDGAKGVPTLKKLLTDKNPEVRYLACIALWKVAKSPNVVPVLVDLLKVKPNAPDDTFNLPLNAARALGEMGSAAKDALPALKVLAPKQDPSEYPRLPAATVYPSPYSSPSPAERASQQAAAEAIDKIENKPKPKRNVTKDLLRY